MAILDLGYRAWQGSKTLRNTRWSVIALSSLSLVWRAFWLRRLIIFATLPSLLILALFFLYEQSQENPEIRRGVVGFVIWTSRSNFGSRMFDGPRGPSLEQVLIENITNDPEAARHSIWSQLLFWFNRSPQAFLCIILIGMVGPRLICYDLRSRAYLLYLSRPVSIWEYLFGKMAVLISLLAFVTTIPSLVVYCGGLLLSPSFSVFWVTWDIPLRIIASLAFTAIPMSALVLAYASFTSETRFANAAWFATWIIGQISYGVLTGTEVMRVTSSEQMDAATKKWQLLSPYQVLESGQRWIFGISELDSNVAASLMLVGLVTVVCLTLSYRRFVKLLRG